MSTTTRHQISRRSIALLAVVAIGMAWSAAAPAPEPSTAATEPAAGSAAAAAAAAERFAAVLSLQDTMRGPSFDSAAATTTTATSPDARRRFPIHESPKVPAPPRELVKAPPKPASPKPASPKPAQSTAAPTPHKHVYAGTNHFWIPSLGMSYGVGWYACGRTSTPANRIYRWGCAGRNNVYLLGHAWGVMKPLHDLYVSGGLRRGMVAVYADGSGHVRKYRVTEWRVVRPTEIAWQIAAQPVPSMTLQTCIGAKSQYRLNVRLVAVN